MKRNKGVDIIIPVYNALEDLKLCIESIKKHTDLSLDRVIMIDDQSPDQSVYPYMCSCEGEGIVVLRNEKNLGFSGTINRGMLYSDRDVILLNSDTVVTANWVDKLVRCAYSDIAIGTVTPFSNNATLCSIPNFCQENTVPYGLSIDEYAAVIERSSLRAYPRITVAVGFCMFIKRELVESVGLFDQETFERGYGEENDFCWRAEQLGYYHVLCDDTYIYHSGSASFVSKEKQKLMEDHQRILDERYPKQVQGNSEYVRDNPHEYLRSNADIYAKLKNGKKNLLYFLHLDFRPDAANNIGGTQFHVKDMMNGLRGKYNVFVVARDENWLRLTIYLEKEQISFRFHIGDKPDFQQFRNEKLSAILRQIIRGFEIDMVHVHHISGLSFDIFYIAHEMGLPIALSLHDYYYICPTLKLLEKGKSYCAGRGENCAACLKEQLGYAEQVDYLGSLRRIFREVLNFCQVVITPSEAAKAVYAGVYPEIESRVKVIPHGMDAFSVCCGEFCKPSSGFACGIDEAFGDGYTISGWALEEGVDSGNCEIIVRLEDKQGKRGEYRGMHETRQDIVRLRGSELYRNCGFRISVPDSCFASGEIKMQIILRTGTEEFGSKIKTLKGYKRREKHKRRIAFLGGLNEIKGSELAYRMISRSGSKYEWYLIGGLGDPNLVTLTSGNVRKIGWYMRDDVGAILQQNSIDLVCILPIVPETFCYTLSEAVISGVPVLVRDIGALGERVRRDNTGWILPRDVSAEQALDMLEHIFAEDGPYGEVSKALEIFHHPSNVEVCGEYEKLYSSFPDAGNRGGDFDAKMLFNGFVLGQAEGSGGSTDMDMIRRVNELETTLAVINQSIEYKIVKFFNREKMPFKRQIKWLLGVVYRFYKKIKHKI